MAEALPLVYLARHGETAWSLSGQHTGRTDLPLTESGERNARALGVRLRGLVFAKVFTSPSQRAVRTCELAGFAGTGEADPDLAEWDYGRYEGRRTAEILEERPDWQLFRDGCPDGESPAEIGARADASSAACAPSKATFCWFQARTSCACSLPAGSAWNRPAVVIFC